MFAGAQLVAASSERDTLKAQDEKLTAERDQLKTSADKMTADLKANQSTMGDLQARLDTATKAADAAKAEANIAKRGGRFP